MRTLDQLQRQLGDLDGAGYGAYKKLAGRYAADGFSLSIDRVQSDPYAPPSKIRVIVDRADTDLPARLLQTVDQRVAAADFLARDLTGRLAGHRDLSLTAPGQQVLPRSSVVIGERHVEIRMTAALPAAGRRIKGRAAARLLGGDLPAVIGASGVGRGLDLEGLEAQVRLYEDQLALQARLPELGLIAFVGAGSVLPRRSGDSDLPLDGGVPFIAPESLLVEVDLPSGRRVTGMGVPHGITVIVGGGYHGKSTLLRALERGVYPHVGGDGREWVLTVPDAAAVRAEDGRAVTGTDISAFIRDLPSGARTDAFTTANASGSTSQAANLAEAVEAGARALLIDEDTSATNFMIRDEAMRELIPAASEPITPFVDRVEPLLRERGVSTVLVAGGSGTFFPLADHVIAMDSYVPREVTEQARRIAREHGLGHDAAGSPAAGGAAEAAGPEGAGPEAGAVFPEAPARVPDPDCLSPRQARKPPRGRGLEKIQVDREDIDLSALSQLMEPAQTQAIALMLPEIAARLHRNPQDLTAVTAGLLRELSSRAEPGEGLDLLGGSGARGDLALPRAHEIHAAICRLRTLRLS